MKIRLQTALMMLIISSLLNCGGSGSKKNSDTQESNSDIEQSDSEEINNQNDILSDDSTTDNMQQDAEEVAEFDPDNPGLSVNMMLISMSIMGQDMVIAAGAVHTSVREYFNAPPEALLPVDTCVLGTEEQVSQCSSSADCAPEQECVPEKDNDGNPVPQSEHCETPVELLDVGEILVSGFADGDKSFSYNMSQSGTYTENGQGEGQIDAGALAYDTVYQLEGAGSSNLGLGAFSGELRVPPALTLTSPAITQNEFGMSIVTVNPAQPLMLRWNGSQNPANTFTLTLAGTDNTLRCRLADDGEFEISSELLGQLGLNTMLAMLNNLSIDYTIKGTIEGSGITTSDFSFQQVINISIQVAGN